MKVIRLRNHLTVILSTGEILTNTECEDSLYNEVIANQDNEELVKCLIVPEFCKQEEEFKEKEEEIEIIKTLIEDVKNEESLLTYENDSVYIKSISDLSVPKELVAAIIAAEKKQMVSLEDSLLQSYLNFWTLASLNPDAEARKNLFWFLNKYGMKISSSGLFVAYRNVELKTAGQKIDADATATITAYYTKVKGQKKSPKNFNLVRDSENVIHCVKLDADLEDVTVLGSLYDLYNSLSEEGDGATTYTDSHSKTFEIKMGKLVWMDRSKCDSRTDRTCSNGLHVAGKKWLEEQGSSFYGNTGVMVLVSPTDVVAVPHEDNYGKMRCCAYYPVQIAEWKGNRIVEGNIDNGFQDDFFSQINYTGEGDTKDLGNYKLEIPTSPSLNKTNILQKLADIKASLNKYVE